MLLQCYVCITTVVCVFYHNVICVLPQLCVCDRNVMCYRNDMCVTTVLCVCYHNVCVTAMVNLGWGVVVLDVI